MEETDVTLKDSDGFTALIAARNNQNHDVVTMLRRHKKIYNI